MRRSKLKIKKLQICNVVDRLTLDCQRERERKRDRDRQRETETDRQRQRETHTETERERSPLVFVSVGRSANCEGHTRGET